MEVKNCLISQKSYLNLLGELYKTDNISIEEIHGGGSQRQYFRVKGEGKDTVLCYSEKELEEHIETGLFLKKTSYTCTGNI